MTSNDNNELEQITASFSWTPEEFKAAYKDYSAVGTRIVFRNIFRVLLLIASLLIAVLVSLQKGFSVDTGVYGICLLLIGGVSILYSPWYQTRQFIRYRAALCDKTVKWEITSTELVYSLSDGTGGMSHWDSITSARKGASGILLFITPQLFNWFPYHAFKSSDDINRLERLVTINVKNFSKMESNLPQVVSGFLIAPFFATLPSFCYSLQHTNSSFLPVLMQTAMSSLPISYAVAGLLGIPLFVLLRKFSLFNLTSTLISGIILGLLPIFLLAPKFALHMAGRGMSLYLYVLAMNGLISALVFWMIAGTKSSATSSINKE